MVSSNQPERPPEFFLDRGLGKTVALRLGELGWCVHRITDYFPDDAADVTDPEWMDFGLFRGWIPLHKDGRIRGNPTEREPVERYNSPMFYLDNQQLRIDEMVRRIHMNQSKMYALVKRRRPSAACYAVNDTGVHKRWP
ncbi:hypothetical protein [Mycolicibacterium frederiksbergense]|uniref:PIN-like domain-containing protein n=1 Tax=Mycolicibacterium frederiksbergense TaxID=117567 RepID=UPI00265C52A5|nr:hypothetical protein [Mycolicibacterium frederiksbergense]MDO0977188.1 hypothetical protein [Mycolicibacterium frederiksbergense]